MNGTIRVRHASMDDCHFLFELRNDPVARLAFIHTEEVTRDNHIAWLQDYLQSSQGILYIAEDISGNKLGVVRFDISGIEAEVSINISPDFRGKGLGFDILTKSLDTFRTEHPDIVCLKAHIKPDNLASQKIFKKSGFVNQGMNEIHGNKVDVWIFEICK